MRTLVSGGTVVTATDTYPGDVLIEDEKILAIGTSLPFRGQENRRPREARASRRSTSTRIWTAVGGTTSADDFESGRCRRTRNDTSRRLRDSIQGANLASGLGHLDEEARARPPSTTAST